MSRGNRHAVTGLLLASGRGLVIAPDDGGTWLIGPGQRRHRLLGRQVAVDGVRIGFDELWVDRITAA